MTRLRNGLVGVLVVGLFGAGLAFGQARARSGKPDKKRQGRPRSRTVSLIGVVAPECLSDLMAKDLKKLPGALKMTEDQKSSYDQKAEVYQAKIAPLLKQLGRHAEQFGDDLNDILTAEQRKQLARIRVVTRRRLTGAGVMFRPATVQRAVAAMELSAEKQERVITIATEAQAKIKALSKKDRRSGAGAKILREMTQQIERALTAKEFEALKQKIRGLGKARGAGKRAKDKDKGAGRQ